MADTKIHILASVLFLLAGAPGCSAIVEFDRSQIGADGSVPRGPSNRVETPEGTLIAWAGDFRSGNVVGWALFEGDDRPVELEVVNEAGAVVGSGTANLDRPDVVVRGHSDRPDVGYQIAVSGVAPGDELRVRLAGLDIELPNNPILVD